MNVKPLPCPFCGREPRVYNDESGYRYDWHLSCENSNCRVQPGLMFMRTEEEAVEAWNRRSTK